MLDTKSPDPRIKAAPETVPAAAHLSVVIPAYNEEMAILQTVAALNQALSALPTSYEIIVVDDGSTDKTAEHAESTGVRVIRCQENGGYGSALKRGIAAGDSDLIAIIDADGTYPVSGLIEMLTSAEHADMVVGARSSSMTNVPFIRRPAKLMLTGLANYLAQKKIPDLNSGLRVFRREVLTRFIPLLPMGFSFTTTITLCMICSGLRVVYVPIEYGHRIGRSKIRFTDFFNFILLVLRTIVLFNPLRVFLPLGFALFLLGTGKLVYDIFIGDLSESAVLGILAAIIIWSFGLIADMLARLHLRP